MSAKLESIEGRAGASDQDREAWLAMRRSGVTATEVRDIASGKKTVRDVVAVKLDPSLDSFSGNRFTDWGVLREPEIAKYVREHYGIEPEHRVFHAADNPRYLASPDGVGIDFTGALVVSEYKTTGKDMTAGGQAFIASGHRDQCLWVMRVIGAPECLYVWEERLDDGAGGFKVGGLHFQWIEYDAERVAQLEVIADRVLEALDGDASPVDEELDTLAVNYLRFLGEESAAKKAKEGAFAAAKAHSKDLAAGGSEFQQVSALARVTWKGDRTVVEQRNVTSVDEDAARTAAPAVFEAVAKAELSVERAQKRLEKAVAAAQKVLGEHSTTALQSVEVPVRGSFRITAPKTGMEK